MAIIVRDESLSRPRGGGGKLNRSETVTVRLDPKLNYLCELAARAQRRTKSSFIEWAIETALRDVAIPGARRGATEYWTIAERSADLWDVEEPDRICALAEYAPSLLTHEEQLIWKLIQTSGWFWLGSFRNGVNWKYDPTNHHDLIVTRVREKWDLLKQVAAGEVERSTIAEFMPQTRVYDGSDWGADTTTAEKPANSSGPFDGDLDDDVPF